MRWLWIALALLVVPAGARGQTQTGVIPGFMAPAGTDGCGPTTACFVPYSATYPLPVADSGGSGSPVVVTTTGFTPATAGTPIAATTGGVTGTLPAGAVVVATNVGATNGAFCALGAASSTSWQYLAPGGGWFAFTVGAATQLTCLTSASTTTINMVGGAGLASGVGGGGGSGGGNVNLNQVGGSSYALGSATSSASMPVVIASDQAAVSVKQATASNLNAEVVGAGTAGTPSGGVVSIQGVPSGTAVAASLPTTPSIANGNGVLLPPTEVGKLGTATHSAVTTAYNTNTLFANNTTGNAVATTIQVTATTGGDGFVTRAYMDDSGTGSTAPGGWTVYLFSGTPTTTGLVDRSAYVGPYAADLTGGIYLGSVNCASFTKTNDSTFQWWSECTISNGVASVLPYLAVSGQNYVNALFAYTGSASYTPISSEALTLVLSTTRSQ